MKKLIVGRNQEVDLISRAVKLGRNLLIEGPVGVGKTYLVSSVLQDLKKKYQRVDGDTRYTEQKLTGWFDPPQVLKIGYSEKCFLEGPLVIAMKEGLPLFVNELNRMPEAVQNILLPAMDERQILLPKIGKIEAKPGFVVIATQNPREFTATHALSEALMDRFEMIRLEYQSREDEIAIVKSLFGEKSLAPTVETAVDLIRATRSHTAIKRGASLRAAIAICDLVKGGVEFEKSCLMALSGRVELVSSDEDLEAILKELLSRTEELKFEKKKENEIEMPPSSKGRGMDQLAAVFFPPELAFESESRGMEPTAGGSSQDLLWKLYQRRVQSQTPNPALDKELVRLVINHARQVVAHPARPTRVSLEPFVKFPEYEIALEETLEENPNLSPWGETLVEATVDKRFSCVMMLDTSASMSGEKHLLGSIAVAVLLLQLPAKDSSVIVFSSKATSIKDLSHEEDPSNTVLKYLRHQPRGFTNIADGLEAGIGQFQRGTARRRRVGLIATDGRSTEGGDPIDVARKFDRLIVLHLHGPGSHLDASREIAQSGNGICLEVERFDHLPYRLYDALRLLVRMG